MSFWMLSFSLWISFEPIFSPMSHFYTPWKRLKTYGFLTFPGGVQKCDTGLKWVNRYIRNLSDGLKFYFRQVQANFFHTAQKMKFFIEDFFSKCDQIHKKLRIWSHLLKKSLMENFIFCAVSFAETFKL